MRSQLILRRTRSLIKHPSITHRALISSTRVARYPRKDPAGAAAPRLSKRLSSSVTSALTESNSELQEEEPQLVASAAPPDPTGPPSEDAEKPKRRRAASAKESEPTPPSHGLPNGLDILWLPQDAPVPEIPADGTTSVPNSALPPPELLNEVLTNLYITLHPQTQHRAAYASPVGPPVEPTLALYCPIEGGDYIIDATVRELGRQAGAEVVVLDAVHLAAGECGHFGKAASVLQLPSNPLHLPSFSPGRPSSSTMEEEDDDDGESYRPSSLTLHVLAPASSRSRGAIMASPRKSQTSMLKVKAFFDELINVTAPTSEDAPESNARLPRIIYVRDFTTLSATSSSWYPPLLAAVRSRRQGPLPRQSSPVYSPTTIVFGITPPIVPNPSSFSSSGSGPSPGLLSYLMSRQSVSISASSSKPGKSEFTEDDVSEKARERRLKERLRRWERGDPTLLEELPQLATSTESEETPGRGSGVVIVGGEPDGVPGLPSALVQALGARMSGRNNAPEGEKTTRFYRTSFIVPASRSILMEKACRIDRRREVNELTVRMGIASVGGSLPVMEPKPDEPRNEEGSTEAEPTVRRMWEDWGREIEVWSNVRKIADRAVGKAIAERARNSAALSAKASLEPVPVEWNAVFDAWVAHKASRDMRKSWVQHSSPKVQTDQEKESEQEKEEPVDEVIERLKRDPDLDQHEQRLLGCIVDTASIPTTFAQVHLPSKTIDSVRTIVSLPLLHPSAFQHGILKEHAMTGCLLFGPPGTGKTLVVRALAKEAGCRMLAVSPSDVMDMYVGEGEKLVKSVFSLARRLSPCVVFIDEIDALFGARSSMRESGGAIAHRGVLTEFMQEMDGLRSSKDDNIIVIGATNRPFDLDDAILRRLPRRLLVDLPGEKEREEILKILLRDEKLAPDVDLKHLAKKTGSFSGSDLKHLCVSAALDAVKERVEVPWRLAKPPSETAIVLADKEAEAASPTPAEPPSATTLENTPQSSPAATANIPESSSLSDATSAPAPSATEPSSSIAKPSAEAPSAPSAQSSESKLESKPEESSAPPRILNWRNFTTALREITPSSSEALGSLSDLRKWNEEFGEGMKDKKHKSVWGKGKFGFIPKLVDGEGEGKVVDPSAEGKRAGATSDDAGAR